MSALTCGRVGPTPPAVGHLPDDDLVSSHSLARLHPTTGVKGQSGLTPVCINATHLITLKKLTELSCVHSHVLCHLSSRHVFYMFMCSFHLRVHACVLFT